MPRGSKRKPVAIDEKKEKSSQKGGLRSSSSKNHRGPKSLSATSRTSISISSSSSGSHKYLYSKILVDEWSFEESLARKMEENGSAKALIDLEKSGFKISEGDPLLLCVVDCGNDHSVRYANGGNFALPVGAPGHAAWPGGAAPVVGAAAAALPAGVDAAPPNALASFLRGMPDIVDKSGGHGLLFYVPNMGRLYEIPARFQGSAQFRRIGPNAAALFGVPAEPSLVEFYTLDTMRAPPHHYPHFNYLG